MSLVPGAFSTSAAALARSSVSSRRGIDVVGVDPADAMINVARSKPWSDRVRWVCGDATSLLSPAAVRADMATMTDNVAKVFLTDEAWIATLHSIRAALRRCWRPGCVRRDARSCLDDV